MSMHDLNVVFRSYNDTGKPLRQRPVAWCFLLLYGVMAAGTAALAASFLIGKSVPPTPVASVAGKSCGYLYEGCQVSVTAKPTFKPTAFPTEPPVPTQRPSAPTGRPTKQNCQFDSDCFDSTPYCLYDKALGGTKCSAKDCQGNGVYHNPCMFFDSVQQTCRTINEIGGDVSNVCWIATNPNPGACFAFPTANPATSGKCCFGGGGCVPA